ncbi:MAG: hypothetical protein JSS49_24455 [Planctomycetes bacterium]|nr:hypothetical protein [Planctomycetota bacterium]
MPPRIDNAALRRLVPLMAALLGVCVFVGCSLFPNGDPGRAIRSLRPSLPPIQTSHEAVQLEVFFVDRPADDPLLGPALWREVDQISAIPAETRESLEQNGFQVGHVGSSPPVTVQTLMGLVTDLTSNDTSNGKPMFGMRKRLSPGVETQIQASNAIDQCSIKVVDGPRTKTCEYDQVRCMFRLKSARLRDGWVRIDFQPEIHHGELRARITPTEDSLAASGFSGPGGWAYQNRQKVDVRHAQHFSLTLNVGEIAIVTALTDPPDSMGRSFFCREEDGRLMQRVLIVRVADGGQPPRAF